jgi:hypothetical protein
MEARETPPHPLHVQIIGGALLADPFLSSKGEDSAAAWVCQQPNRATGARRKERVGWHGAGCVLYDRQLGFGRQHADRTLIGGCSVPECFDGSVWHHRGDCLGPLGTNGRVVEAKPGKRAQRQTKGGGGACMSAVKVPPRQLHTEWCGQPNMSGSAAIRERLCTL